MIKLFHFVLQTIFGAITISCGVPHDALPLDFADKVPLVCVAETERKTYLAVGHVMEIEYADTSELWSKANGK